MEKILDLLKEKFDLEYKEFHQKLIPSVDKESVLGVRMPVLRKLAKDICQGKTSVTNGDVAEFLQELPHKFYDENNLHMLIISEEKHDLCTLFNNIEKFLPYIDNWATCDSLFPKLFEQNKSQIYDKCFVWLKSDSVYIVRFAIITLMRLCAKSSFDQSAFDAVLAVKSDEYYIKMAIAWYIAEVAVFNFDIALEAIRTANINAWVKNMAIKKACESFRVDKEQKEILKSYKTR